jgi:hypothetical protein
MRTVVIRGAGLAVVTLWMAVGLALPQTVWGADGQEVAGAKATGKAKTYRRLPPHYKQIVNQEQQQKIYQIQEEYGPKVEAARVALAAIIQEQKEKISGVLTEEQKKELQEVVAKGKTKKK